MAISNPHKEKRVEENKKDPNVINDLNGHGTDDLASEPGGADLVGMEGGSGEQDRPSSAAQADELQALQEKYLRLAAEFENYKRLAQRDQREFFRFANESLLKELLPIADNLERALGCAKKRDGNDGLVQGVELTLKQFLETLSKFGVRPIASVGEVFDPTKHQAVARVESSDKPDHSIVEELQKGYLLHDRVLRAAMVTVATSQSGNSEPSGVERGERRGKSARSSGETPDDSQN